MLLQFEIQCTCHLSKDIIFIHTPLLYKKNLIYLPYLAPLLTIKKSSIFLDFLWKVRGVVGMQKVFDIGHNYRNKVNLQYIEEMGNQEAKVLQDKKNNPIAFTKSLKSSKPGSKTTFKYIKPIAIDDDCEEVQEQQENIQTQVSAKINEEEYALMEQIEQDESENQHEDIRIKWNSFIKMKKRNYLDDYIILKEIGRGGFGKVNKVRSKYTGLFRAAKKIKKSTLGKQEHEKLFIQMAIMKSLDHINIIRLYEVYDYKSHYVLILELCEGGELFKKIITCKELSEDYIAKTIKQILKVLLYLKHLGVIHRDLKPENMLFERNSQVLKIIDFGIAYQKKGDEKLTERVGTPYYVAPEVLLKKYDQKCDIWSTGVIMYMMMTHKPPFRGENEVEVMQKILEGDPPFKQDLKVKYSPECLDLLKRMLIKNPDERINVMDAYEHPWLKDIKIDGVDPQNKKEAIQNIQTFKFKNKMEAVVYTFIVSQLLTTEEKSDFIQIFEDLDHNHDGVISKNEFRETLKKKSSIPQARMSLLMKVIDTNSSGYIDLTQFIVACLKMKNVITQSHFQQAFSYFDIDHSGSISYEEIAFFLQDSTNSQEIIKRIFQQVDENSDGAISRDEFVKLLMKESKKFLNKSGEAKKV